VAHTPCTRRRGPVLEEQLTGKAKLSSSNDPRTNSVGRFVLGSERKASVEAIITRSEDGGEQFTITLSESSQPRPRVLTLDRQKLTSRLREWKLGQKTLNAHQTPSRVA
jgi:hypothetical protein